MRTSQHIIAAALFIGLASASFAGPGAEYFQRRAKKADKPLPVATASSEEAKSPSARSKLPACCRDVVSYKRGPSGKTSTRVVTHECSCS